GEVCLHFILHNSSFSLSVRRPAVGCIVWLGLIICRKPACLSTIFDVCHHFVSILKLRWFPRRRSRVPADVGVRPLPILSPCCLTGLWLATGQLCLDAPTSVRF